MTEIAEDTYVSWIDRQTEDDKKAYYDRVEAMGSRCCPFCPARREVCNDF